MLCFPPPSRIVAPRDDLRRAAIFREPAPDAVRIAPKATGIFPNRPESGNFSPGKARHIPSPDAAGSSG